LILVIFLAVCFYLGHVGNDLPLGVVELASFEWHPSSLIFFINGSAMISKTLKIPKL
jgi:CDP-diacylglycerol--serine O-phosphatidyltransferase